jgi:PAP2 superfamily
MRLGRGIGHGTVRQPRMLVVLTLTYLMVATALMVWRRIVITPDYLFFLLMPIALVSGRLFTWIAQWTPFIGLLLGWEAMRGLAGQSGATVRTGNLGPELWLFHGQLPTLTLQGWLDHGALGQIMNDAATVVYLLHFPAIVAVAMILWLSNGRAFGGYVTAVLLLCLAAFVVFLTLPTAPPWWAAEHGLIQGMDHIFPRTLPSQVSPYYQSLNPNDVAADPSLHAALPFLGFMAVRQVSRRWSLVVLTWAAIVWFTVVYLGEHYVLDAVTGVACAGLAWGVVQRLSPVRRRVVMLDRAYATG